MNPSYAYTNQLKEARTPSKQIHKCLVALLARFAQSDVLLASVVIIETAYFLSSLIDGTVLVRTVLVLPAAYILPGFVLRLLTSESSLGDIPSLIVESFLISTTINVVILSLLILLKVQHYYFLLPLSQLLLVVFVVILVKVQHDLPKLYLSKADGLIILTCFLSYLANVTLYTFTPRLPTPDETNYIANARLALLSGKVYDIGAGPATSAFTLLIKGRFFWTLLTASFLASTGLEPQFSHLLAPIFLFMIPLASLPLLHENPKNRGLPRLSLTFVLLTNPLLFYFSGFILNDIAIAFYVTFALALFVNSFGQDRFGESINFSKLILCFSVFFLSMVFIKSNLTVFLPMYAILLFFILKHKTQVIHRRLGYVLLALPVFYELLIDVPYNLFNWVSQNEFFARMFRRFIWVSPLEQLWGFFAARPWTSTTLFSHDAGQYLQVVYTMVSPEVLGLILASMALVAPFALALKWVRRDRKMVIISLLLTVTLAIEYCIIVSNYSFRDVPRFGLFLIPIIVAFSLSILTRETDEHNVSTLLAFCIPAILFLWIFAFLSVQVDYGIYFYYSYGTPLLNWTINIVAPQLIIYIVVLSFMSVKRIAGFSCNVPFVKRARERLKHVELSTILYSTLMMAIIAQNLYVSAFCVKNSSFFGQSHGLEDTHRFLAGANDSSMIFSNTYIYMRNYVADNVLAEGRLFPLPKTENEFLQLLGFAPNGSLIMINTDPEVTWREDANSYIKEYASLDTIVSNASNVYAIRIQNEQLSTGQISLFRTVNPSLSSGSPSQITVNDARLVWLNKQEKTLELNISSSKPSYVEIMIKTDHFVELFNTTLTSGNNIVRLGANSYYKRYVTKAVVFVVDQDNNTIYDEEVVAFNLEGIQISYTLIFILVLPLILFLTRKYEPMRKRAYVERRLATEWDSSKMRTRANELVREQ